MILCVFGTFNIITAIFVETTISGLKHNDVQKKRNQMYQANYVQGKLDALIEQVLELQQCRKPSEYTTEELNDIVAGIRLSPGEFQSLMQDKEVKGILTDLDIDMFDAGSLFDIFDPDGTGVIPLTNFFATIMRVRGEPQKSDTIANWVAIRLLSTRFENFELLALKNQKRMIHDLREIAGNIGTFQEDAYQGSQALSQEMAWDREEQFAPVAMVSPTASPKAEHSNIVFRDMHEAATKEGGSEFEM
jgi:hypothetical protein